MSSPPLPIRFLLRPSQHPPLHAFCILNAPWGLHWGSSWSAGWQDSPLAGLSRIAQIFLSPKASNKDHRFIPALVREWLKLVHMRPNGNSDSSKPDFYGQFSEAKDHRHTGRIPIYAKSGIVLGYQSPFSLNPGYAVIILTTGSTPQPATLTLDALRRPQPLFEEHHLDRLEEAYVGA